MILCRNIYKIHYKIMNTVFDIDSFYQKNVELPQQKQKPMWRPKKKM